MTMSDKALISAYANAASYVASKKHTGSNQNTSSLSPQALSQAGRFNFLKAKCQVFHSIYQRVRTKRNSRVPSECDIALAKAEYEKKGHKTFKFEQQWKHMVKCGTFETFDKNARHRIKISGKALISANASHVASKKNTGSNQNQDQGSLKSLKTKCQVFHSIYQRVRTKRNSRVPSECDIALAKAEYEKKVHKAFKFEQQWKKLLKCGTFDSNTGNKNPRNRDRPEGKKMNANFNPR